MVIDSQQSWPIFDPGMNRFQLLDIDHCEAHYHYLYSCFIKKWVSVIAVLNTQEAFCRIELVEANYPAYWKLLLLRKLLIGRNRL